MSPGFRSMQTGFIQKLKGIMIQMRRPDPLPQPTLKLCYWEQREINLPENGYVTQGTWHPWHICFRNRFLFDLSDMDYDIICDLPFTNQTWAWELCSYRGWCTQQRWGSTNLVFYFCCTVTGRNNLHNQIYNVLKVHIHSETKRFVLFVSLQV